MLIGQLAEQVGLDPQTIRFYEYMGLLPQSRRTPTGYGRYGSDDRERITFIKSAQCLGMSLDEIGAILAFRDRGELPCPHVEQLLADRINTLDERINELVRLRDRLLTPNADME